MCYIPGAWTIAFNAKEDPFIKKKRLNKNYIVNSDIIYPRNGFFFPWGRGGGGGGSQSLVNALSRIPPLCRVLTRQNVVHNQLNFFRFPSCQWLSEIISELPQDPECTSSGPADLCIFQVCLLSYIFNCYCSDFYYCLNVSFFSILLFLFF